MDNIAGKQFIDHPEKRRNKKSFSFDSLKYRHIGISRKSNERFHTNYATKQYTKGL